MEDISVRTPGGDFDYVRAKSRRIERSFYVDLHSGTLSGNRRGKPLPIR
ncbi:MAG: hypothetical protein R3C26_26310 [Calditrichia bacterium]